MEVASITLQLSSAAFSPRPEDTRIWLREKNENVLSKLISLISRGHSFSIPSSPDWESYGSLKVCGFVWKAYWDDLNTLQRVQIRNPRIALSPFGCPMHEVQGIYTSSSIGSPCKISGTSFCKNVACCLGFPFLIKSFLIQWNAVGFYRRLTVWFSFFF